MKLVLIVEDEHGNAQILQLLLEAAGYRVAVASNGKQALEVLRDGERPSLILSDFMMPAMNGGELGLAIRQDPALGLTPFIFMSATNEEVVQQVFRDYDAFLVKPIQVDSLLSVVSRFIEEGRPARPRSGQVDGEVDESVRQLLQGIRIPPAD